MSRRAPIVSSPANTSALVNQRQPVTGVSELRSNTALVVTLVIGNNPDCVFLPFNPQSNKHDSFSIPPRSDLDVLSVVLS